MSWDGKMHGKYRIEHADGTPLKGEKYFVLRLGSDDPVEAARVAAAMRAYKSELRNCDLSSSEGERQAAFISWYNEAYDLKGTFGEISTCDLKHDVDGILHDYIKWLLAPATEQEGEGNGSK